MKEVLIDTTVTYTLELDGKFYVIEQVPARVCQETGAQYFAPDTVRHIHALIRGDQQPDRIIETPVYRYA